MERTIWMNVTTSAHWRRPAVGIVRVERALWSELSKLFPAHQFRTCIWQGDGFVEWKDERYETVDSGGAPAPAEASAPSQMLANDVATLYPLLSRQAALVAIVQGVLSLAPARLRPYVNRLFAYLKPRVVRLLTDPKFRRWARGHTAGADIQKIVINQTGNSKTLNPFKAGDVLISVGLDWDQSYSRSFYFLRKQLGIRIVTCCYDLIPVLYPQYCVGDVANKFAAYFLDVAEGSDLILCISSQSQLDLKRLLQVSGGAEVPTWVFPLGDNVPGGLGETSAEVSALLTEPFILFVSTIERRKNHEVLYRAYHLLCVDGKREQLPKLVFVGMQGWGVGDLLKDIELDPLTQGLIVHLAHVEDFELRQLYESASFCVYPSLYEGWGLPVGEALALGKVVLSSNRGSLPEVGGDLVRYVDPWSPRAWADEIWRMHVENEEREQWSGRVRAEYHVRTWEEAARSVKRALDEQVESPHVTDVLTGYDMMTDVGRGYGPIIRSSDKTGWLFYGPYRSFLAGRYDVKIFDVPEERVSGRAVFDVVTDNGRTVYWVRDFSFDGDLRESPFPLIEFELEFIAPVRGLEIRCSIHSGRISIKQLTITMQSASPEAWPATELVAVSA